MSHHRSEKECSDISIYGSVLVLITSNSGLERGSTILGQTVYQSWVKLLLNRGSSCCTIWIRLRAADHNQIVVISYSDSDCNPPLVHIEESHQV